MYIELQLPTDADPERFLLEIGRGDVPNELRGILSTVSRRIRFDALSRQTRGRRFEKDPGSYEADRQSRMTQGQRGSGTTLGLQPINITDVDLPAFSVVTLVERNVPSLALHRSPRTSGATVVRVDATAFRVAQHLASAGRVISFIAAPIRNPTDTFGRGGGTLWTAATVRFDFRPGAPPFDCSSVRRTLDERARAAWLGADGGRKMGQGQVGLHFSHAGFSAAGGPADAELVMRSVTPAWMGPHGVLVTARPTAKPEPEPEVLEEAVAVVEAAPEPVPEECGGIDDLVITCMHGARQLGSARVLQVVAANPKMETSSLGGSDARPDPGRKAPRGFEVAFKRSRPGGEEELACTVSSIGPAPCGQSHIALLTSAGAPSDSDETQSPVKVLAPDNTSLWSRRAPPNVYHLYGKCCGGWSRHSRVESYPAQRYGFHLVISEFRSIFKAPHKWLEEKIPWYRNEATPWMEKNSGGRTGPVGWSLTLMEPEGKFEAAMGWHEDTDWRAYHELQVTASLNVLCGVALEFTLSLAHIAATAALSSLGVPPPVSNWLSEKGTKYLGDVWVFAEVAIKLFISGTLADRHYPSGSGSEKSGEITGGVEGALTIGVAARIGSRYWVSIECRGTGTVKLAVGDTLGVNSHGVTWNPAVKAPPVLLTVSFVAKAASFTAVDSKSVWEVSKAKTLWEPETPWKLLNFDEEPAAAAAG